MPASLMLFSCGVIFASLLPQLPSLAVGWLFIPLCLVSGLVSACVSRLSSQAFRGFAQLLKAVIFFLLGSFWGISSGHELLRTQLAGAQGAQEFMVSGFIDDLPRIYPSGVHPQNIHPQSINPQSINSKSINSKSINSKSINSKSISPQSINPQKMSFVLSVDQVTPLGSAKTPQTTFIAGHNFPKKLKLSWYQRFSAAGFQPGAADSSSLPMAAIKTGDYWQMRVRLKPPRGFVNPAGFDYQAWLLRRGIGATGYVVDDTANTQLSAPELSLSFARWIDLQRYQLQQWLLAHSDSSERGILIALLIGDSSLVDKTQWLRMQQTGTSHLIAISGLHVGFLAIFGFYAGLWLGKTLQLVWPKSPALVMAYSAAIACALFYSALAGFNIPTLRTAIMLTLFYWLAIYRRSTRGIDIYCVALALVMILDPLAAFDMGFWLSFGAVGLLLFYFSGRYSHKPRAQAWQGFSPKDILLGFLRSQWVMFIGLLVPLSLLINSVSLLAPIANFIAIPLITFFVVPCLLLAAALQIILPEFSALLIAGAEVGMEWLAIALDFLLRTSAGKFNPVVAFAPGVVILLFVSCGILLLPKGLIPRALGYFGALVGICLTFILPSPQQPDLRITVLDVGQGTAVVLQTSRQTLVYDTGPAYSEEFDAGSAIVLPYLRAQGITHIDKLIVSHMDNDHAGGLDGLLKHSRVDELLLGELPRKATENHPLLTASQNCHQVSPWQWGDVSFRFLSWPISSRASANNHSCVLLIRYADQTILLPGDIEKEVEQELLRGDQLPQQLTLLLAAHHGSHSSSTWNFVSRTAPKIVVYSAGYQNRYGHPHAAVRKRYQALGTQEWNTAQAGALLFEWRQGLLQPVIAYREQQRRYWFIRD